MKTDTTVINENTNTIYKAIESNQGHLVAIKGLKAKISVNEDTIWDIFTKTVKSTLKDIEMFNKEGEALGTQNYLYITLQRDLSFADKLEGKLNKQIDALLYIALHRPSHLQFLTDLKEAQTFVKVAKDLREEYSNKQAFDSDVNEIIFVNHSVQLYKQDKEAIPKFIRKYADLSKFYMAINEKQPFDKLEMAVALRNAYRELKALSDNN